MTTPTHPTAVSKPLAHVRAARDYLHRVETRRHLSDHWTAVADVLDELLERLDPHWQPDQRSHVTRFEMLWDDCLADIPQPGSAWEPGNRGGAPSNPTARGAITGDHGHHDRNLLTTLAARIHARTRASITDHSTHLARLAHDDADQLARLISRRTPRQPLAKQREATVDAGLPGCHAHQQAGTWTPVHKRWRQGSDDATDLCSPCYTRAVRTGVVPTPQDVDRFDRTGRWPKIHDTNRKAS